MMKNFLLWMLACSHGCLHPTRLIAGLAVVLFAACTNDDNPSGYVVDEVEVELSKMSLREKVGQMFFARLESLDSTIHWETYADLQVDPMIDVNKTIRDVNVNYPVGGVILYAWNIVDETQLARVIADIRSFNGSPLLCIDEEGGRVSRIANNPNFDVKKYVSMDSIGKTGDPANAYECGHTIGTYLKRYGFDIDFAPVADVNTNPDNIIIGPRAFSDDPQVAAPMVTNYLQGLKDAGITGPSGLLRRSAGGCPDGDQLSAGTEGCRHHGLHQALPGTWRHPGRHPLRLCPEPEDLG